MAATKLHPVPSTERRVARSDGTRDVATFAVIPLANAVAVVAVAAYVICAAVTLVSADLLLGLFQLWAHGISLEQLRPTGPVFRPETFVLGLLTFTAAAWLTTTAIGRLYNAFARR